MSRMNNTARSLQIVSIQNGWDPNRIEERGNGPFNRPVGDRMINEIWAPREHPNDPSTTWVMSSQAKDPTEPCPDPQWWDRPTFETPTLHENEFNRTDGADPYPGIPGARPIKR